MQLDAVVNADCMLPDRSRTQPAMHPQSTSCVPFAQRRTTSQPDKQLSRIAASGWLLTAPTYDPHAPACAAPTAALHASLQPPVPPTRCWQIAASGSWAAGASVL